MHQIEKDREISRWQTFTGILFQWEKMSMFCSLADPFLSDALMRPYLSYMVISIFTFVYSLQKLTQTYQILVSNKILPILVIFKIFHMVQCSYQDHRVEQQLGEYQPTLDNAPCEWMSFGTLREIPEC